MDDQTILSWNEKDVIANVYHQLRQNSTVAKGFAHILADGRLGYSNIEQKEIIETLQHYIEQIVEINRWLEIWTISHEQDDDSGVLQ